MKKLALLALVTLTVTPLLLAQTTMCFKENHNSMATIDQTKLDGGLCNGVKTSQDMQKDGWKVDDIKLSTTKKGYNYIYIFKKNEIAVTSLDEKRLEDKIIKRIAERKKEEALMRKIERKMAMTNSGKQFYINRCQQCHGENADVKAHNTSRPLVDLSLQDMQLSIRGYTIKDYDRGRAFVMQPYALMLNTERTNNVYLYIQSLKEKKNKAKK